jgi:hypothetical protein
MAILTMFEVHGDPDELVAVEREKIAPIVRPIAEANGAISNTIVKTERGIMVVNQWETEEGMEKTAAEVRPHLVEAGMAAPVNWQMFEVVEHRSIG